MEYSFITLDDGTQISHSEMLAGRCVRVYIVKDMLHRAVCLLPDQSWTEVVGFGEDEMLRYQKVIQKMAPLIMEFSQKGGFRGSSGLED